MERQINEFNFTIEGEIEQIGVQSLSQTLLALDELLIQVNSELGTNKKVELTVKTYKPGSFDVYLQLLADQTAIGAAAGLFSATNLETAKTIISVVTEILGLKKFLKGKPPQQVIKTVEGDNYEITNNTGNVVIIQSLTLNMSSENEKIDDNVRKIFSALEGVPYVRGLSIKDNEENPMFVAEKKENDFKILQKPNPVITIPEENERDKTVENAILSVYSITFNNTKNWEFFYEGRKIPAKLKHTEFIEDVLHRRIKFANGDRLKCNLIIRQKYNEGAQVYENKSYTITNVESILPPEVQQSFLTTVKE